MKTINIADYSSVAEYDKAVQELFYKDLPNAMTEIEHIFQRFDLSQKQAACVVACALNKMVDVNGEMPKVAFVSLQSALTRN